MLPPYEVPAKNRTSNRNENSIAIKAFRIHYNHPVGRQGGGVKPARLNTVHLNDFDGLMEVD